MCDVLPVRNQTCTHTHTHTRKQLRCTEIGRCFSVMCDKFIEMLSLCRHIVAQNGAVFSGITILRPQQTEHIPTEVNR